MPEVVSVSALSDRGVKQLVPVKFRFAVPKSFSIRSFGSWGEAASMLDNTVIINVFQYPLFRIVG